MRGPIPAMLSDIHMVRTEVNVVTLVIAAFYRRYVDATYNQRRKDGQVYLYEKLNSYNPIIRLTVETNLNKFMDTKTG